MLDTIQAALRGGDYAAAAASARTLTASEPGNAEAHHLLGLALRLLGDLRGAEAAITQATQLSPQHAPYHVSRAMLATLRNDAGAARAALNDALVLDPNQLMAYVSLAQLALSTSDLAQAEQHVRFAERINADHPHVLTLRGQLLLAGGDGAGGINAMSRAAQLAPADALVQGTLGLAYLQQNHHAFAEQALRNALAVQPQARSLRFGLLQALLAQGRNEEAEHEADTLLAQHGDDPQALLLKGQFCAGRGAHADAVQHLTRALERQPEFPRALDALLGVWIASGAREQAETFVEQLLQRAPQSDATWSALVELHRGQSRRAAEVALRWQQARPDSPAANELAAQVLEVAGDYPRAAELAQQVLARAPNQLAPHLVMARTELRDGRPADARARLESLRSRAQDPALRRALSGWLGRACDAVDDADAAVQAWLEGQALISRPLPWPALVVPDAALEARVADALAASSSVDTTNAPVLLWGAPGSGVDQLAALLRGSDGTLLLADRFGPAPRSDGFALDGIGARSATTPDEAAQRFAQRWRDGLAALGADPRDIDWLPHWDARLLPPLVRGLPGARMLVALRDPRDMLLNWLAFGAPQRLPLTDPLAAAQWLALALEQLAFLANRTQPALRVVWMDQLDDQAEQTAASIAGFVGLAQTPSLDGLHHARRGVGGLPTAFPHGHWKRYAGALREPFAALEPIAQRLGGT